MVDDFDFVNEVEPTHRAFPIGYVEELQKELKRYTDENRRLKEWIGNRSEYRSRALKAGLLLNRVIDEVEDPWFYEAYEGLNDGCIFCGSQNSSIENYKTIKWHTESCLWFDIHTHLGHEVSVYHKQRAAK